MQDTLHGAENFRTRQRFNDRLTEQYYEQHSGQRKRELGMFRPARSFRPSLEGLKSNDDRDD